jgi:colanic acid/amylovoran biosynthesis glycosyltransferase
MKTSTKTCLLFTQSFPFGETEVFVERELQYLSSYFEKVIVCPLHHSSLEIRKLPANVSIFDIQKYREVENSKLYFLLSNFYNVSNLLFLEFTSHPYLTLKFLRRVTSDIMEQIRKAKIIKANLPGLYSENSIVYSFWFDRWITALGLALGKNASKKIFSRAHAFDLYEEDNTGGYILYRKFQFKHIKKVFPVSAHGERYLKKKHPNFKNKIHTSYLGTAFHDTQNPFDENNDPFVLVSCGSVQKRKRTLSFLGLIESLPLKYKLIHFGDGPDMNELIRTVEEKKLNDRVVLRGNTDNDRFLDYLRSNPISLFMSLSSNEGLPYSMIESISFGIPLLSTNVGGCSEICNEHTGILIEKNFDVKEVADRSLHFQIQVRIRRNLEKV